MNAATALHPRVRHRRLERLLAVAGVLLVLPALLSPATWAMLAQPSAVAALALLCVASVVAVREAQDEPKPLRLLAIALVACFATLLAAAVLRYVALLAFQYG